VFGGSRQLLLYFSRQKNAGTMFILECEQTDNCERKVRESSVLRSSSKGEASKPIYFKMEAATICTGRAIIC